MSHTGIRTGVSVLVTCAYFVIPSSWMFNQQMCQPEQPLAKRLIGAQVQVCLNRLHLNMYTKLFNI